VNICQLFCGETSSNVHLFQSQPTLGRVKNVLNLDDSQRQASNRKSKTDRGHNPAGDPQFCSYKNQQLGGTSVPSVVQLELCSEFGGAARRRSLHKRCT
jgi:hypothetical protein